MTLAISYINNDAVYVLADTQLTFPSHLHQKPFDALKIFFLDLKTAITYSGTTEHAHQIIFQIYHVYKANKDLNDVSEIIKALRNRDDNPDFLLIRSGTKPEIYKISDLGVTKTTNGYFWVGDREAANYVSKRLSSNNFQEINRIFDEVIESRDFETVGGYSVLAHGSEKGFRFVPYLRLISPRYVPKTTGEWETVQWGTNATGGFGYSTITPINAGQNGYGLYFFQGNFGFFFHIDFEKKLTEKIEGRANSINHFLLSLKEDIKVEIESCGSLN